MRSDIPEISKDLLIYSALAADFEPLDFKNDALAGVRANYFNAGNMPQSEITEFMIDSKPLSLSYSMKNGEPLSWKAIYNNQPYQTVKRELNGKYCVLSYNENGMVYKRQYFDYSHTWLRTEYFSPDDNTTPHAALYPKFRDGIITLVYKQYAQGGKKQTLFPSLKPSGKKCRALVYSNSGMLWFDQSFKPSDFSDDEKLDSSGFNFKLEAFTNDIYAKVDSKLDNAPYLTGGDIPGSSPETPVAEKEPDNAKHYSAYDKIERILFEAHKTNKNIFGELANEGRQEKSIEPKPEVPKPEPEKRAEPEIITKKEPEQKNDSDAFENDVDSAAEEMLEAFGGNPGFDRSEKTRQPKHQKTDYVLAAEGKPDSVISSKSGRYLYYGSLDENNRRTGRGRTVSEKGLTSYDGEYVDDKRQGFGICYYKEGSVNYVGNWNGGNRDGAGVGYRLSDGTMHAGSWSNNAPSGFGARFDKYGNFLDVCTYIDGKRSGKSVSFDEDGNIVVRIWNNGELISEKIIGD